MFYKKKVEILLESYGNKMMNYNDDEKKKKKNILISTNYEYIHSFGWMRMGKSKQNKKPYCYLIIFFNWHKNKWW